MKCETAIRSMYGLKEGLGSFWVSEPTSQRLPRPPCRRVCSGGTLEGQEVGACGGSSGLLEISKTSVTGGQPLQSRVSPWCHLNPSSFTVPLASSDWPTDRDLNHGGPIRVLPWGSKAASGHVSSPFGKLCGEKEASNRENHEDWRWRRICDSLVQTDLSGPY